MPIPPEVIDLLICCAGVAPEKGPKLEALISKGVDWNLVVEQGRRHGILPLLYWSLKTHCPDKVPDPTMKELGDFFQTNARKNLFAISELLRILGLLEEQGIKAIPFKGPVLTSMLYGNPGLRCYGDLDILVSKTDLHQVKKTLLATGYLPEIPISSNLQEAIILRTTCEYNFYRENPEMRFEVHWEFAPSFFFTAPDQTHFWEAIEIVPIGKNNLPSFSTEMLFIVLCIHGSKHLWGTLKWLNDIARIIEVRDINWLNLIEQASRLKCLRMVRLGALLAKRILNVPLPNHIQKEFERDRISMELTKIIQRNFYFPIQQKATAWFDYVLKVQDGMVDRFRCSLRLCFTPTNVDWQVFPLPEYLYWFYYLFRPFRLFKWHVWDFLIQKKELNFLPKNGRI